MEKLIRLDKLLSNLGYGSRKQIKKLIDNKKISVNGNIIYDSSIHINPYEDEIIYDNEKVYYSKYTYIVMNKPKGFICANEDNFHRTVFDLLSNKFRNMNLSVAGRLDKDTEGLLILTNDGDFIHELISPKKNIFKKYYVELESELKSEQINSLEKGILLITDNYITKPAKVEKLSSNSCFISISEGKFHQVKRMFIGVNNHVTFLKRVSIGNFSLPDDLPIGDYKLVKKYEIQDNLY